MKIKLAFAICIFLCMAAMGQKPFPQHGMNTGFVELTVFNKAQQRNERIMLLLRKDGKTLELVDLIGNTKHKTKIIETKPWGVEGAKIRTATFDFSEIGTFYSASRISFSTSDNKKLSAVWESNHEQSNVTVRTLAFLYGCSNHKDPMHTAESEAAKAEKTARYGCSGWHELKAADYK